MAEDRSRPPTDRERLQSILNGIQVKIQRLLALERATIIQALQKYLQLQLLVKLQTIDITVQDLVMDIKLMVMKHHL